MVKIDVIINVYGKPWQTLCTLKSLLNVSAEYIDKIYLIEERQQPYGEDIGFILKRFKNLVHFIPESYEFIKTMNIDHRSSTERFAFRYQYGIESSDKKFVFITHNDMLYFGDIIGNMLKMIGDNAGIGAIGQCWNCPASSARRCDGDSYANYKPTYEEVIELLQTHPPARGEEHNSRIDTANPMPLPECRLNEFACLINREISIEECPPRGNSPYFGAYGGIDLGCGWFRSLVDKGYSFKNYNILDDSTHGFYSKESGHSVQLNAIKYKKSEEFAKSYFYEHLNFQT